MACAPDRGRNLNVELQSCWPGYSGGVCKRLQCKGLGGFQCSFAQRGQWRGPWEPVNLTCIPRGAGNSVTGRGDGAAGRAAGARGQWH